MSVPSPSPFGEGAGGGVLFQNPFHRQNLISCREPCNYKSFAFKLDCRKLAQKDGFAHQLLASNVVNFNQAGLS